MSDELRDEGLEGEASGIAEDEAEVSRLLVAAGRRPELPAEELAWIRGAVDEARRARPAGWEATQPRAGARSWRRVAAAALAASVLVAVGIVWWRGGQAPPEPVLLATVESIQGDVRLVSAEGEARALAAGAVLPAGGELRTGAGGFAALGLPGGGSLRLDAGSRLLLVGPATVSLQQGAVYADSGAAGTAARIVVRTPLGEVRDVGTQFTARLRDERRELEVRVREGRVIAAVAGARHAAHAGEELVVDAQGHAARRPASGSGPEWQWVLAVAPRFAGEGRTVRELLEWSARETGWRVSYENDAARAAASTMLHGDLGALAPDRAPFAVLPGAGLAAELRDGMLVVRVQR